jgi:hypothetical protein
MKTIVGDLENGLWDADLGGGVYKKRLARAGAGKSGGYRTIVFFKSGERAFFQSDSSGFSLAFSMIRAIIMQYEFGRCLQVWKIIK